MKTKWVKFLRYETRVTRGAEAFNLLIERDRGATYRKYNGYINGKLVMTSRNINPLKDNLLNVISGQVDFKF